MDTQRSFKPQDPLLLNEEDLPRRPAAAGRQSVSDPVKRPQPTGRRKKLDSLRPLLDEASLGRATTMDRLRLLVRPCRLGSKSAEPGSSPSVLS
ncbi:hypothetical protein U1Q18_052320, partial [Sarracenia purpurea var. burkii]